MVEDSTSAGPGLTWAVGAVATRLGTAAATLRTWERRYGIGPSHRTAGGHRRYTERDVARLRLVLRLTARGTAVHDAAQHVLRVDDAMLDAELASGQPGDLELADDDLVGAVLAATDRLDPERLGQLFATTLARHGAVAGWDRVLAPALRAIGRGWAAGHIPIHAEHLASERLKSELRAYTRERGRLDLGQAMILLASAEEDQHSLPIMALEAALAEHGLGCHALGPRFPAEALARMSERVHPDVVFLWASIPRATDDPMIPVIEAMDASSVVLLGGPGWPAVPAPGRATRTTGLAQAVTLIEQAVAARTGR